MEEMTKKQALRASSRVNSVIKTVLLTEDYSSEFVGGMSSAEFLRNVHRCLTVDVLDGDVRAVVTQQLGNLQAAV